MDESHLNRYGRACYESSRRTENVGSDEEDLLLARVFYSADQTKDLNSRDDLTTSLVGENLSHRDDPGITFNEAETASC